jgi:hypothetical protein
MMENFFNNLKSHILVAAGVVLAVFGLFNAVLTDLVPPSGSKSVLTGMTSLVAMVLLAVISLTINVVTKKRSLVLLAFISLAPLFVAVVAYFFYNANLKEYVYQSPAPPANAISRHIRGELHAEGKLRLRGDSVDKFASKDLEAVLSTDVLWTQESQRKITQLLELQYFLFVTSVITSIFMIFVSISVYAKITGRIKKPS